MNLKIEIINKILSQGFSEVKIINGSVEGISDSFSIIIAAFPYSTENNDPVKGVKISPFVRSDHYGEAVKRLKKVSFFIREKKSLKKNDIRIFCNSGLKEKLYAASSGLGFYGRNSLIITKKAGSKVILAGLIVPFLLESDGKYDSFFNPGSKCGSCSLCVQKCPTGAIENNGVINRDKCLQSLTTDKRILSDKIMGTWGHSL